MTESMQLCAKINANDTTLSSDDELSASVLSRISDGDKIISGFAVHPGVYNQIFELPESEIDNVTNSIKNSVLLKDHSRNVDSAVGKVLSAETKYDISSEKVGTYYQAFIDSSQADLIKKVDRDIINSCSIGFEFDPVCGICGKPLDDCEHFVWDDGFTVLTTNVRVNELSMVTHPADPDATVGTGFSCNFSEELKNKKNILKGDTNMTDFEAKYDALKEEFASCKEDFENKLADKTEECLSTKSEVEALQAELSELKEAYGKAQAQIEEVKEAQLSELRAEVLSLNEELQAGLTEEEVAEFSENMLNRYLGIFTKIKENNPDKLHSNFNHEDEYKGELAEDANPMSTLLSRVQ